MPMMCIPSLELGTNDDLPGQKDLPFNFTLGARYVNGGPGSLLLGLGTWTTVTAPSGVT